MRRTQDRGPSAFLVGLIALAVAGIGLYLGFQKCLEDCHCLLILLLHAVYFTLALSFLVLAVEGQGVHVCADLLLGLSHRVPPLQGQDAGDYMDRSVREYKHSCLGNVSLRAALSNLAVSVQLR